MNQKKAQITIFVILGLVLLLIAGIVIYFVYQAKTANPELTRSEVSKELHPVQIFIEGCMQEVGQEGLIKMGSHGGYIDPYDPYLSGRAFILDPKKQYESDFAYLSSDDPQTSVAYWYYSFTEGNCINCAMMSQTPYIDEMERQLSIYISEHIDECLQNLTTFKAQGMQLIHDQDFTVRTTIRDNDVVFEGMYTVNISSQTQRSSMDKYYTIVDIPLKKYYLMALNITSNEYETGFLENINAYLVYSYSGLSSDLLPPLYATSGGYNVVYWTQYGVNEQLKQLLSTTIPLIQVPGTANYQDIPQKNQSLYEQNFYKFLNLDFFGKPNPTIAISFYYTGADIYTRIQPSKDQLIGPKQDRNGPINIMPSKQQNTYQFFYDISYPVIIEIRDEYKPNQYYSFMFALEPTVKENLKLTDWWNESKRPLYYNDGFFSRVYNDPLIGQNISDNGKTVPYKQKPSQTLFCDEALRVSGNITFKVYDSATQKSLDHVGVSFGCGTLATCALGEARFNTTTKVTQYTTTLPSCQNGFIMLDKQGYLTKQVPLTTEPLKTKNLGMIYLEPIVEKNVTVQKFTFDPAFSRDPLTGAPLFIGEFFNQTPKPITANDTVIITFTRKLIRPLDTPWTQTVVVGRNATEKPNNVYLAPGEYTVSAQYIDYNGVVIPKHCDKYCKTDALIACLDWEYYPEEPIPIIPAPWGGIEYNENNTVVFTIDELTDPTTVLNLSIIRLKNPQCLNGFEELSRIGEYSEVYRPIVAPRLN